jgi:hypothetical protein
MTLPGPKVSRPARIRSTNEQSSGQERVAVAGNVLENIRVTEHPLLVMKQGSIVHGDSGG